MKGRARCYKADGCIRPEAEIALKIYSAVLLIGILSHGVSCMAAEPPAFKGIAIGSQPSAKEIEMATGTKCWPPAPPMGTLCVLTTGTYAGARGQIYVVLSDNGTVKRIDFHLKDKAESAKDFLVEKFGPPHKDILTDSADTASRRGSVPIKFRTLTWQVTRDASVIYVNNAANPSASTIRYGTTEELDRLYGK